MRLSVAAVVAASLLVAGCSSDAGDSEMVRTGQPTITVKEDGTLSANPVPLTLADVQRQPRNSARRAVMEELFWIQWGSWPNIFDGYHPAVRRAIGAPNLTGGLSQLRSQLVSSRIRIVSSRLIGGRASVQLELLSTTAAPSRESFVLHRSGGRWLIVSDTLLERGIKGFVTQRVDGDAAGTKTTRKGTIAGLDAAATYRAAFEKARQATPR